MTSEQTPAVALDADARLRAHELSEVGTTLTEEELHAVAGARITLSGPCGGSGGRDDEWTV